MEQLPNRNEKRGAKAVEFPELPATSVEMARSGGAQLNMRDLAKIEVVKNNDEGNVIVFEKIKPREIKKGSYEQISVADHAVAGMSNVVAAGTQIAAAAGLQSMGLFRASVTPRILAMFADGNFSTFGTIFSHSKALVAQTSFKTISAAVFAPVAAMQLLAMVTGQYYMNGINKQLHNIDNKIEMLIKFHHTEKISRLESAHALLKDLFEIKNPSIEHLTQLKNVEYEVNSIFREYSKYLEDIDYEWLNSQGLKFFAKRDIDSLLKTENESGFAFDLYMVVTADEILHLLPIIEFVINVKLNFIGNNRSNQIAELYDKITAWSQEDFFVHERGKSVLERYFAPFIERAKRIKRRCWTALGGKHIDKKIDNLHKKRDEILQRVLNSGVTCELRDQLVGYLNQPMEILYAATTDYGGELYVKKKRAEEIDNFSKN